jgi:hypothetical protein
MEGAVLAKQKIRFVVSTTAKWRLAIGNRDVSSVSSELELDRRDEPYLLQFHFHGTAGTAYSVNVIGATLLQPIEGAIPLGYTREGGVVDLKVE